MTWLRRLHPFPRQTLAEIVMEEIEQAAAALEERQRAIRGHRYYEHMERARLEALKSWYEKEHKS